MARIFNVANRPKPGCTTREDLFGIALVCPRKDRIATTSNTGGISDEDADRLRTVDCLVSIHACNT